MGSDLQPDDIRRSVGGVPGSFADALDELFRRSSEPEAREGNAATVCDRGKPRSLAAFGKNGIRHHRVSATERCFGFLEDLGIGALRCVVAIAFCAKSVCFFRAEEQFALGRTAVCFACVARLVAQSGPLGQRRFRGAE